MKDNQPTSLQRYHLSASFLDIMDFVDTLRLAGTLEYPDNDKRISYEEAFLAQFKAFLLNKYNSIEAVVQSDVDIIAMMQQIAASSGRTIDLHELSKLVPKKD